MIRILEFIKYPGIRALLFLIFGILIGNLVSFHVSPLLLFAGLVFVVILMITFHLCINRINRMRFMWEFSLSVFFMICGIVIILNKKNKVDVNLPETKAYYLAEISSCGIEKQKSFQFDVNLQAYKNEEWISLKRAKALLYIGKNDELQTLNPGDNILFYANPVEIKNYGNPGEFDYKQYCSYEGIKYQFFIKEYVSAENKTKLFSLLVFTKRIRERLIERIHAFASISHNNLPIFDAIVLGYKAELDRTQKQTFSEAGIMHFMAISGLHVGIIYLLLSFPLKILRTRRLLLAWKLCIILALWGYALFTGFSSSVVRATTMFTFYHIGQLLNRNHNGYNSLAWSGFLTLAVNPFQLFQAGFQLSYLAVTSILFFYPLIYKTFFFRNTIYRYIWQLVAFTLSAQILILPILAYNFKQLALLSVFTNLILTPIMFLMLGGGVIYVVLIALNINFIWLGRGLDYLIDLINNVAVFTSNISFSNVDNISMHPLQLVIIYLFIASIVIALIEKKSYPIYIAGICLCVFFLETAFKRADGLRLNQFVVFNVPGQSLYSFINGKSGFVWKSEKNTSINESNILQNYFTYKTYKESPATINLTDNKRAANVRPIYHNHLKILQVYGSTKNWSCKHALNINVDVLIVSNNAWLNMDVIQSGFNPRYVIFDSSNTYTYYKKVSPYVLAKLPRASIHYVTTDGAFIL